MSATDEQDIAQPEPPAPGLAFWGSECLSCFNATAELMVCDACGSATHTVPLWIGI